MSDGLDQPRFAIDEPEEERREDVWDDPDGEGQAPEQEPEPLVDPDACMFQLEVRCAACEQHRSFRSSREGVGVVRRPCASARFVGIDVDARRNWRVKPYISDFGNVADAL